MFIGWFRFGGLLGEVLGGGLVLVLFIEVLLGIFCIGYGELKLESGEWEVVDKVISRVFYCVSVLCFCFINSIFRVFLFLFG